MYKNMRYAIAASMAAILFSWPLLAQTTSAGREIKKAEINFTERANYYKAHPQPVVRKPMFDEDDEEEHKPKHHKADPAKVHLIHRNAAAAVPHHALSFLPSASPAPSDTFQAVESNGSSIPPDTHGDVDSQYCVTAINTTVNIQTRDGVIVTTLGIDEFWAPLLTSGPGAFDPRVHYDPFKKRWIMVADAYGELATSQIMVAVSATSDPTGSWNMYSVLIDPTGGSWLDFPCVGFNKKWITVTGNLFPISSFASGAVVYIFDYASIMAVSGAPYTEITEGSSFTLCPALTYDTTEPNMYALETNSGGAGQLQLWKISGPVGAETISSVGYPATALHWQNGGSADFVPQAGTANLIQAGDDRITRVVYRNHELWCAHTVFLPASGPATRTSVMWWEIDTTAVPVQNGLIDDANTPAFFDYPSIAVNVNNDVLVGFGYLSSFIHPSAAYALHMHTDAADSMRKPVVFRHGQATYYQTFSSTQDRWGDYSATTVDPRNNTDFWTIQESVPLSPANYWDTWWANVQLCDKPSAPVLSVSPVSQCAGTAALYAVNSIAGATTYQWIVSGSGWSGSSTSDSITITAGAGTGTITVLAYNSCGEGTANTFSVTPLTVPAAPLIITIIPACIGSPNAVFSASSGGASGYSWQALGTGWSGGSSGTSLTAAFGTGTGTVICTATDACGPSATDTLLVTPATVPVSTFAIANHIVTTAEGDVFTFTGTAPAGATFTWSFGGGTGTPGTGPGPQTDVWLYTGLKTVMLTVSDSGCSTTYSDTVLVTASTGVQQINAVTADVHILPNPNNGSFDITFGKNITGNAGIVITDMQGRAVYTQQMSTGGGNKVSVAASKLIPGDYTVSITAEGNVVNKVITVTK